MKHWTFAALSAILLLILAPPALAVASPNEIPASVRIRLAKIETQLNAQSAASEAEANAFDAATSRMEFVNGALVAIIALAGIASAILGVRWVRQTAHQQIAGQVEKAGRKVFEEEADSLRNEYEEKFAHLYKRYNRVVDDHERHS